MTVKIARLKNGEDIIAEIKEVYSKDTERLAALSLEDPYQVTIIEDPANMFSEGDEPFKTSNPKLGLYPWTPLSAERTIYIDPTELLCAYDPQAQVLEQYNKLLEAINHGGGDFGGGVVDESLSPPDQVTFTEESGDISDWDGNRA
jgi:hypothetical protein